MLTPLLMTSDLSTQSRWLTTTWLCLKDTLLFYLSILQFLFFYRLSSLTFMRWLLLWGCQFLLLSLAYSNSCLWLLWCLEMSQFTTPLVYLERTFIRLLTPTILLLTELWSSVTIFLYFLLAFFHAYLKPLFFSPCSGFLSKPLFFHFELVFIKTFYFFTL